MKRHLSIALLLVLGMSTISAAQTIHDTRGFLWDLQANGSIMDGTSDTFDGGFLLFVNGSSFDGAAPQHSKNIYSYGPLSVGGVRVTRHIMAVKDPVGIVMVESFNNPGDAELTVSPMSYSDMGETAMPQQLNSKKGGMQAFVYPQQNGRSSVTAIFGDKSTKYLPSMTTSGDELTITFPPFKLGGGQTKSIGYFIAQRPTGSGAELRDDKRAFSKALAQIASKMRFTFLNLSGMNIFSIGDIELVAQGESDYLETRGGDKVFGNLSTAEFTLETSLGKRSFAIDKIVNIIGLQNSRHFQVIANDGSALTGKLEPNAVQFGLSDGGSGEISLDEIERLVPKMPAAMAAMDPKERAKWFKFDQPLFVFKNDDRIAGELMSKSISIHTGIGKLTIPLKDLRSIELNDDSGAVNTASFVTKDGQAFSGVFYEQMEVKIWNNKSIKISPSSLKTIYLQGVQDEVVSAEPPKNRPLLKLNDADFLFARILSAEKPLEFKTAFGVRTMNPEQISRLENVPGLSGEMRIQLWDGSNLTGKLISEKILFEILGRKIELLPSMVNDYSNPTAVPPESLRQKYVDLIRQLGSPKFADRQTAFDKLERDAEKIKGLLESHLQSATNTETRARLLKLLGREKEDDKKKTGKPQITPPDPEVQAIEGVREIMELIKDEDPFKS